MINSNNKIQTFTDLNAWREGHTLVLMIYKTTKSFPKEEMYAITDQMQRAASSVTANIAEGFGRHTYSEKVQYFYIAQGSLTELKNFLIISRDVGYITVDEFSILIEQANVAYQILQGLITKSKSFINRKS